MSNSKKERNKDIINFLHLSKDLYKYIKRKIIKKYVDPEMVSIKSKLNDLEEEQENWKYYNTEEKVTAEDKIYDIFKDNSFLGKVQKCYESLEILINSLEDNKRNYEYLKKNIEVGEQKIKLLSELNSQLNQYFNTSTNDIPFSNQQNNLNCMNNQNVIGHLSLVKSFNILNDLKIINSIKDLNTHDSQNENNNSSDANIMNNNIILDINNIKSKSKDKKNSILKENKKNKVKNDLEFSLLKKKTNREAKNEKYIELNEQKSVINSFVSNFSNNENSKNINNNENNIKIVNVNDNNNDKEEEINKNEKKIINNLIDKININKVKLPLKEKNNNSKNSIVENYINITNPNSMNILDKPKNQNKENGSKNLKYKESAALEFEKILKSEFSSIYSNPKKNEANNDIIQEIKNILNKISEMKFPQNQKKFEDPSLIGTHKNIDTMYLLDSLPAIDILFKCKDIKSIDEINSISEETMHKKLCLSYIEICKGYDKESEIVKVTNKCKIKIKDNYFFIYINLFYVNVNISTYNKKEQCIKRYMFSNEIYNNKDKVLICLFFRRWRRKFKLFFMIPEFLDIIINFYYNETESISLIIENIFYDLINGEINFYSKNVIIDDEKNINEIVGFIGEWYNFPEHKTALNSAIVATNECLLKNDFSSIVKTD